MWWDIKRNNRDNIKSPLSFRVWEQRWLHVEYSGRAGRHHCPSLHRLPARRQIWLSRDQWHRSTVNMVSELASVLASTLQHHTISLMEVVTGMILFVPVFGQYLLCKWNVSCVIQNLFRQDLCSYFKGVSVYGMHVPLQKIMYAVCFFRILIETVSTNSFNTMSRSKIK